MVTHKVLLTGGDTIYTDSDGRDKQFVALKSVSPADKLLDLKISVRRDVPPGVMVDLNVNHVVAISLVRDEVSISNGVRVG